LVVREVERDLSEREIWQDNAESPERQIRVITIIATPLFISVQCNQTDSQNIDRHAERSDRFG
jgi:hypothetical protein